MHKIGLPELLIVLVICLLIFGPKVLPKIGRSIGRTIHSFKKGVSEDLDDENEDVSVEAKKTKDKKNTSEENTEKV